ncbi:hypothetical protein [Escherichia phage UPEC06]|nr:hypothetical protein [Escherichia phage UPEC06]
MVFIIHYVPKYISPHSLFGSGSLCTPLAVSNLTLRSASSLFDELNSL